MAEPVLALSGMARSSGSGARISEVRVGTILQVQAWPETLPAVKAALAGILFGEPPALGEAVERAGTTVAHVAPGRFMLASADAGLAARVAEAIAAADGAVTDLSHGRAILALDGEAALPVLQKCVTLDLGAFPVGRAAPTAIHHIDVLIHRRTEARFELWVLRSFAVALAEWLLDMGLEEKVGLDA
jgi:sarcosine oxidase subunit gamma